MTTKLSICVLYWPVVTGTDKARFYFFSYKNKNSVMVRSGTKVATFAPEGCNSRYVIETFPQVKIYMLHVRNDEFTFLGQPCRQA